jgi:putative copper resistance protein D
VRGVPGLWTLAFRQWQLEPALDCLTVAALIAYLVGARRVRRGWPWPRTLAFTAGLAAVAIATQSGYDADDDVLLSVHMIQHLLLLEVAPLLLLSGRPAMLALQAAPPRARPAFAQGLRRLRPLTHPVTCLVIYCAVLFGCHTPAFFDATVTDPLLHDGEHGAFLAAGMLMWWPVLDGDPIPGRRLGGLPRLGYVMVAMMPMTLIGVFLDRDPSVFYPAYLAPARALGVSAIADQQQAGAIMWVLGGVVMVAAGIWQTMAALKDEERRLQQRERHLDAVAAREAGVS